MNQTQTKKNLWLKDHGRSVTSQGGEDGILEKVLEVIGDTDRWCVEFGSWDGEHLSNTYNLINNKNYSAVLIEGSPSRYKDLVKNFRGNSNVRTVNRFVGFEPSDCLCNILKETEIPRNFDLLSIDIDGNDYHVWDAAREYQPKVVIIEFNGTIPKCVEFVQPRDMAVTQGTSLLSMIKLAKSKGYELVTVETSNAIFVDKQYFDLFNIDDNSIETQWTDQSAITHIFIGYDGSIFLRGFCRLPWQGIALRESMVQVLPRWARKTFKRRNFLMRKLAKFYRCRLKD